MSVIKLGRWQSSPPWKMFALLKFQTGLTRLMQQHDETSYRHPPRSSSAFLPPSSLQTRQNVDSSLGSAGFDCFPKTAWCGLWLSQFPRGSPQSEAQVDGRRSIIPSGESQTLQREYTMLADSSRIHSSHGTQRFGQRALPGRPIQRS